MVAARKKTKKAIKPPMTVDELVDATIKHVKSMTLEEGIQSLIDAGIYTSRGYLAKPYRVPGEKVPRLKILPGQLRAKAVAKVK
ncbi:hypothetical protein OPIT5_10875 [Opitutaceae bacterium TAV5]|nr:hypothetical protein OPIT5_10875 [Opitutaceae bacterium TAV5]